MEPNDLLHFRNILTTHGHNVTQARETTFKLLLHPKPQSVRDLQTKARGTIDRVSLYRNLTLFEKLGIVQRIYIGWKYKLELSDAFMSHHHHLSCLTCGKLIDIEDEKHINGFIQDITTRFAFQPRTHRFEIDGYCSNCTPTN